MVPLTPTLSPSCPSRRRQPAPSGPARRSRGRSNIGQERDYTFSATAGEIVYLESKTEVCGANPPWWQLLKPDGTSDGENPVCYSAFDRPDDIGRVVLSTADIREFFGPFVLPRVACKCEGQCQPPRRGRGLPGCLCELARLRVSFCRGAQGGPAAPGLRARACL